MIFKTDDDLIDEKSFRKKMLIYSINWMTLPKPKKGPNPFEMLVQGLFDKAKENTDAKYEDTLEDTVFSFKKKFFETHWVKNMMLVFRYSHPQQGLSISGLNSLYFSGLSTLA